MQRINTPNKAADLFGVGKHGYRPGNPATGQNPTECSPDAFNAVQEEIAGVIEASGGVLNPASFTQLLTAIQALITNRNLSGQVRSLTPLGGALVREWADMVADTTGNVEFGISYNCAVNVTTGVWAGRDVADICWLEKWSDTGGLKECWYAPTAAAGVVPAWVNVFSLNTVTGALTISGAMTVATGTASGHAVNLGQFVGSHGTNGYQKLPGGLIIQWGYSNNPASNPTSVTFPIAFPSAVYGVHLAPWNGVVNGQTLAVLNTQSTTGFTWSGLFAPTAGVVMNPALATEAVTLWIAIGK